MYTFLEVIFFIGAPIFIILGIISAIKKNGKAKKSYIIAGASFVLFIITASIDPSTKEDKKEPVAKETTTKPKEEKKEETKPVAKKKEETKPVAKKNEETKPVAKKKEETSVVKLSNVNLSDNAALLKLVKKENKDISKISVAGDLVSIEISSKKSYWDENTVISQTAYNNYKLMYDLLQRKEVHSVTVNAMVSMQDVKGKSIVENGVSVTWNKDTVNGMNIDNFLSSNFYRVAEGFDVNPGIFKSLKEKTKDKYFN